MGGRGCARGRWKQTTDTDRYGRADTTTADFSVTVYELIRHQGTYIARSLPSFNAPDAMRYQCKHQFVHLASGVSDKIFSPLYPSRG